jgi:hypothetical protein
MARDTIWPGRLAGADGGGGQRSGFHSRFLAANW